MRHRTTALALGLITILAAVPSVAGDAQPPLTWLGRGAASFISPEGVNDVEFDFELSVDGRNVVSGRTTNDQGTSEIKHVFCSDLMPTAIDGYFTRKVVIVFILNEHGDSPVISVLNGRLLADTMLCGEVLVAQYEPGGDLADTLGIGDPQVTLLQDGDLPPTLTSALKQCLPIGVTRIIGRFIDNPPAADTRKTTLFNGRNLDGWYAFIPDASVAVGNVWQVRDGLISCTGNPTAFLRTKQPYDNYRLALEWRWPDKPGNSGVLLHMSEEDKIWPLCMEAQLAHTRAGDFVGMGCKFNENKAPKDGPVAYTPRLNESSENEPGRWNKYEITCKGDTIEVTVNGRLQNKVTGSTITKGYIGLQSEGVPIMFRNITLTPLD